MLKNPNISNVSYAQSIQGLNGYDYIGVRAEGALPEKIYEVDQNFIDHDFLNVFCLEMVAGKNFRKGITIH